MKSRGDVYLGRESSILTPMVLIRTHLNRLIISGIMSFLFLIVGPYDSSAQINYSDKTDDAKLRNSLHEFIKYAQPLIESSLVISSDFSEAEKKALLLTKMNVSSALNMTVFQEPPIYALLDTWILLHQIKGCTNVNGNELFHENIDVLLLKVSDLYKYQAELLPYKESRNFVEGYAESHPVHCEHFHRDSPLPKIATLFEKESGGIISKITNVTDQVEVLNFKMNYWMEYLPKQMKWQMELLSYDFFERNFEDSLSITDLMFASNQLMTESSELIANTPGMLDSLSLELNHVIDQQMRTINQMMASERRAFLYGLSQERTAAMDTLLDHLESWKDLMNEIQSNSMQGVDQISGKFLSATSTELDKLMNRITILVIVFCITIILAVVLFNHKKN